MASHRDSSTEDFDSIVIGGGFFGCALAVHLSRDPERRVLVLEAESDLLQRASYGNQARVHHGYHYPRSLLTGFRSRANFARFAADYSDCIDDEFDAYYAIARNFSNVTAAQFELFARRIGAPLAPAPDAVVRLFDPDRVEAVFRVTEYAFDSVKLKQAVRERMQQAGVELRLGTRAERVRADAGGGLVVDCSRAGDAFSLAANRVFNCTYARVNRVLRASGLPAIPVKHELVEIALVRVPEPLAGLGITLMCGPFFSVMPFPPRALHSLYHVRYTLHGEWCDDGGDADYRDPYAVLNALPQRSQALHMLRDAARYLPSLADARHEDSLWEVRTVLPISEHDDSRPILFARDHGLANFTSIVGAKIDNVYDMIEFEG